MHQMKAIVCQRYIGIDVRNLLLVPIGNSILFKYNNSYCFAFVKGVATIDDAEMPTIRRSNDLLVQVRAASINVVDAKICHGYSKFYRRLLNSGVKNKLAIAKINRHNEMLLLLLFFFAEVQGSASCVGT